MAFKQIFFLDVIEYIVFKWRFLIHRIFRQLKSIFSELSGECMTIVMAEIGQYGNAFGDFDETSGMSHGLFQ